jgi:uncharacterized protein YprB with RNaseH-like and TPR domain
MTSNVRTQRRRLFFDIETSFNIGFFFDSGFKKNIDPSQIIKERAVICICYKWEDDKEVSYLKWDSKQCDKAMLTKFVKIANYADEIVGHNGDKFDLPWIRTRCAYHHIEMFPSYTTIDTLKIARQKFRFNSNKLDYIAKFFNVGGKIKTDINLWKDIVLHKSKPAMEKMIKYCKQDVIILEKVYNELKHAVPNKTHYGVIFGEDRNSCPECGSDESKRVRKYTTASGLQKITMQCKTCNKFYSKTDK